MGKDSGGIPQSKMDKVSAKRLQSIEKDIGQPTRALVGPQALTTLANNNAFDTRLPAPARQAYEGQFAQARNDIMSGAGGRGGMLRQALTNNANQRAATIAGATDDYRQMGIERALGVLVPTAFPDASAQESAASGIASRQQQRNMAGAQQSGNDTASMIQGIGSMAAMAWMMY